MLRNFSYSLYGLLGQAFAKKSYVLKIEAIFYSFNIFFLFKTKNLLTHAFVAGSYNGTLTSKRQHGVSPFTFPLSPFSPFFQSENSDFRANTDPTSKANKTKAPVDVQILFFFLIEAGPPWVNVFNWTPFELG